MSLITCERSSFEVTCLSLVIISSNARGIGGGVGDGGSELSEEGGASELGSCASPKGGESGEDIESLCSSP